MAQTMKRPGKTKDREFPKYLPQAERERYILDRTVAVFAEHGLSIGTREIAAKIGVTQSLLYKYFASKDALIEAVFQEVFLKRWNNSWEALLRDRSRSIEDRLCTYLVDYSETIMDKSWVRIFLFGALAKMALHRRYLDKLIKDTFLVILDELYVEFGVRQEPNAARAGTRPRGNLGLPCEFLLSWRPSMGLRFADQATAGRHRSSEAAGLHRRHRVLSG